MQDLDWDDLRVALAVARSGTLASAARRLGVNESTVGRRLARMSATLGVQLFERAEGRMRPSAAGSALLERAERVESEVLAATEVLAGRDRQAVGRIGLTAVPLLANRILAPALPDLLDRHPGLEIDLVAEPTLLSVLGRETDIALRLARPQQEAAAVTRRLGQLDYAVFQRRGAGISPLPWIGYDEPMAFLPQSRWLAARLAAGEGAPPRLRVRDGETLLQALRAGLGRSLLPVRIGDGDPQLERSGSVCLMRELWVVLHPRMRDLPRLRVTLDWLVALFDGSDGSVGA